MNERAVRQTIILALLAQDKNYSCDELFREAERIMGYIRTGMHTVGVPDVENSRFKLAMNRYRPVQDEQDPDLTHMFEMGCRQ